MTVNFLNFFSKNAVAFITTQIGRTLLGTEIKALMLLSHFLRVVVSIPIALMIMMLPMYLERLKEYFLLVFNMS